MPTEDPRQAGKDKGWRQGDRAAEAVAAVEGAGRGGRLGPAPAAGRGGEQGVGLHQAHNLQNPENRREILADDKLRKVFGKDKVTMFEMNKHLAQHLT